MIHHYTSIGALASILKNRTVRFSRLNTLDDVEEAQYVGPFNFGEKLFVSCWVEKQVEDIAQWAMYGNAMKGVRISLPRQPFAVVPTFGPSQSLRPELFFDGYCLLPDSDVGEEFVKTVNYVDNVHLEYGKRAKLDAQGGITIFGKHTDLATFKHKRWAFQQEVRFVLHAMLGPSGCSNFQEWNAKFVNGIAGTDAWHHGGPSTKYIDLPLSPESLGAMEIVLGPLTDASDALIVDALVASCGGAIGIRKSELTGLIRHR